MNKDIIKFNNGIDIYNEYNKTKNTLEKITFDIDNIQDFKKTIAKCNKTVKEISTIRIEYKKYWLGKIEKDLNTLSNMENELKLLIGKNNETYDNFLEEVINNKREEIEEFFNSIYNDYDFEVKLQVVLNNLPNNWQNTTYKINKITQDIVQVLNQFKDIYNLCEDKKLIEHFEFNLQEYNKHLQIIKETSNPIENKEQYPQPELQRGRALIEVLDNDIDKIKILLANNGIWFEVK